MKGTNMPIDAYLFFDRNCAEAMRFYQKVLGGKLDVLKNSDAPPGTDIHPEAKDLVMHARLELGEGRSLMASDWMAPAPYEAKKGFSLSLAYPTAEEGKRIFDTLAEGGRVTMPYGETFWAKGFGMCTDRFGTPWMVNGGMNPRG
jgi:PhnB protein